MKSYLFARIKEPSTWRGAVMFLTAIGIPIAPEIADAVITTGLAIVGLIGVVAPDKK
jgi:uncharacterized membrane protein